jgi:tRNA modification GTPase
MNFPPIVAPITAVGGAVAGIRISGENAHPIAARVFPNWPAEPTHLQAVYGPFITGDDGIALPFLSQRGYTGEPAAEFFIHGSPECVRQLIEACIQAGATLARPGEFTERAFLNGRLDLAQAEAVRDLVASQTERQLKEAIRQRQGAVAKSLPVSQVLGVIATIEAHVDYSEELGELDRSDLIARLQSAADQLQALHQTALAGQLIRRGIRIAIVGRPNVGKSSLLNRLLGRDRAIVTPIAGTTRDSLEETVQIAGLPCILIDTAGLRETEDEVEAIGVQRSHQAITQADLIWHLYDAAEGWTQADQTIADQLPPYTQRIANKIDLALVEFEAGDPNAPTAHPISAQGNALGSNPNSPQALKGRPMDAKGQTIAISAITGQGIEQLSAIIQDLVPAGLDLPLISDRQAQEIQLARQSLSEAQQALAQDIPADLPVTFLRETIRHLGRITGETAEPDLLSRIFQDFCLGK